MKNFILIFSLGTFFWASSANASDFVGYNTSNYLSQKAYFQDCDDCLYRQRVRRCHADNCYYDNRYFSEDRMRRRHRLNARNHRRNTHYSMPVYTGDYYDPIYRDDEIYLSSRYERRPTVYRKVYYLSNPTTHSNAYQYVYENQKRSWYTPLHPSDYRIRNY